MKKLALILQAEEHILRLDDGQNRLNREVLVLSRALARVGLALDYTRLIPPDKLTMLRQRGTALARVVGGRPRDFQWGEGKTECRCPVCPAPR